MKKYLASFAAIAMFLVPASTQAAIILEDTPPVVSLPFLVGTFGPFSQFLSDQITLTDAYSISSIESLMSDDGLDFLSEGSITLVVYGDGGTVPDTSNELFSTNVTITDSGNSPGGVLTTFGWYGAFGLDLFLTPGEYWIAFETRAGDTYAGVVQGGNSNSIRPTAFDNQDSDGYVPSNDYFLTLRIDAEPGTSVVPEPASMLLFGPMFGGMALLRRKSEQK